MSIYSVADVGTKTCLPTGEMMSAPSASGEQNILTWVNNLFVFLLSSRSLLKQQLGM